MTSHGRETDTRISFPTPSPMISVAPSISSDLRVTTLRSSSIEASSPSPPSRKYSKAGWPRCSLSTQSVSL